MSKKVQESDENIGILICGTGIGMSIVANKFKGIRCALCYNTEMAKLSRMHNDSNVLALGANNTTTDENIKIVDTWLNTIFEGGRHEDRLNLIKNIEQKNLK